MSTTGLRDSADEHDLTGNDYVSIPHVRSDAALDGINVLHGALAGLIEWTGDGSEPLLHPRLLVDGQPVPLEQPRWRRLDRWIPTFTASLADGTSVAGTICAPGGYPPARGFLVRIEVENRGRGSREFGFALDVTWRWTRHWIASARPFGDHNQLSATEGALTLATDAGRGPALCLTTSGTVEIFAADADGALVPLPAGSVVTAANGAVLRARVAQTVHVSSQRRVAVTFFCGAGREVDGARTAAAVLRRTGAEQLLRTARLELSHILRSAQDHRWADLLNRNLLFNRYYACGRGIDDDRCYLLRSRSTQCAGPAVFNEREALLWTLPALIMSDPGLAREAMFRVFDMFSERAGEYTRYIDGGALDPAFALDQCMLYPWLIDYYSKTSGDADVFQEPLVRQLVAELDMHAFTRLHPEHLLASTDVLPSGDSGDHPYSTYGNALLWLFCDRLPKLTAGEGDAAAPRFAGAAPEIAAAIWQHCVTDVGGHPVFVSTTSLEGDAAVYDDPDGSLALLPFFGFCASDDPVWRATLDFVRSVRYPLWREGAVPGLAARSRPHSARTSALCADLLTHRADDALAELLRLHLPSGVAAAGYVTASGESSEPHHAALAGFLAWTLVHAAEPKGGSDARRKRRRER